MQEDVKKELEGLGADITGTLIRFMNNESLYEKFLKRFVEDKSYRLLLKSVENHDNQELFRMAHTFRGVTGNLGLNNLFDIVTEITERYRKAKANEHVDICELMDALEEEYEKTIAVINKID